MEIILKEASHWQLCRMANGLRIKSVDLHDGLFTTVEADMILKTLQQVDADNPDQRFWDYWRNIKEIIEKRQNKDWR